MSENLTDDDFIAAAREACANSIGRLRQRKALQQMITNQSLLIKLADKTGDSITAIEFLANGNNH